MKITLRFLILMCLVCIWPVQLQAEQMCLKTGLLPTSPSERFELREDVAIDKKTGLMWRRCFEGLSGATCEGEALQLSWPKAFNYISEINEKGSYQHTDWRMPNIRELSTLVEARCSKPALNWEVFPAAPSMRVWSSSPYRLYPHYTWFLDFSEGSAEHLERFNQFGVLLVRSLD